MDEYYAQSIGLPITTPRESLINLRFADSSNAHTSGIVKNVAWSFGPGGSGKEYSLDFYVLKNAPADVILSENFLLNETQAFVEYECYLLEEDDDADDDEDGYLFVIARVNTCERQGTYENEAQYFEDDEEAKRRAHEYLQIESPSGLEKTAASKKAEERRKQRENAQAINTNVQGVQPGTTQAANGTTVSPAQQTQPANPNGSSSSGQCRRWLLKLRKKRGTKGGISHA